MSNDRGVARVGQTGSMVDVFLVDARTQKPVQGAKVEAIEEQDGLLLRVTKDDDAYEPETLYVRKGAGASVPMNPSTPDMRGKVMRLDTQVFAEDFIERTNMDGVAAATAREERPNVLFLPAPTDLSAAMVDTFDLYRSSLPGTLVALKVVDPMAAMPSPVAPPMVVRSPGRLVQTSGPRKAGIPLKGSDVGASAQGRTGEERAAPLIAGMQIIMPPDETGNVVVGWNVLDESTRLQGLAIGVDTTLPDKRIAADVRTFATTVKRGSHFACLRPVFDGSEVDPQVSCVNFEAVAAPAAPELRVTVRQLPATPLPAKKPFPVEVEVENTGEVASGGFDVSVLVSRDGRAEAGLGEARVVRVDGIPPGGKAVRRTEVVPPRDGALFVVAEADVLKVVPESNPEDSLARRPARIMPAGNNRAPIISAAVPDAGGTVTRGRGLPLRASAADPEEGDISERITWSSSRDGKLGAGGRLDAAGLSPGRHRIRAEVADRGLTMALARLPRGKDGRPVVPETALLVPAGMPVFAVEPPESVVAEFEVEVVDPALPLNSAPVVTAGPDLTTTVGGEVSPLAVMSDPDGETLTVVWAGMSPSGVPAVLEGATSLRPKLRPTEPGPWRLMVTVTDGKDQAKDEVVINVLAAESNKKPVASLVLPPNAMPGTPVLAAITAADPDGDGLTVSYELERPAGSRTLLAGAEGFSPSFTPDVPGLYVLVVTVDDGRGGRVSVSAQVSVQGQVAFGDGGVAPPPDAGAPFPVVDSGVPVPPPDAGRFLPDGSACATDDVCGSRFCSNGFCAPKPVGSTCNPVLQTCSGAQACVIAGPYDMTACVPNGTAPLGAPCGGDITCLAGTQCMNGTCKKLCDFSQPTSCPQGSVCQLSQMNARWGFCDTGGMTMMPPAGQTGCNPLTHMPCQTVEACYVLDTNNNTQCFLPGPSPEGGVCAKPNDCGRGNTCIGEQGGTMLCRRYCDPAAPICNAGQVCSVPFAGAPYGACMPSSADAGYTPPPPPPPMGDAGVAAPPSDDAGTFKVEDGDAGVL